MGPRRSWELREHQWRIKLLAQRIPVATLPPFQLLRELQSHLVISNKIVVNNEWRIFGLRRVLQHLASTRDQRPEGTVAKRMAVEEQPRQPLGLWGEGVDASCAGVVAKDEEDPEPG